jgi:hypothetical protein
MTGRLLLTLAAAVPVAAAGAPFHFSERDSTSLALSEGGHPVLVYNFGVISRTNVPADRARSSYVHPLYGLEGEVLTDDFPKDHYHHRGLFWAWPHVRVGEREADLWLLKGIRHQFDHWLRRDAGNTAAVLGVQNGWWMDGRKVVDEQAWLRVWPATDEGRAIDLELVLTPVKEALTLRGAEGKSYGGLTLRYAPRSGDAIITTPAGRANDDLLITHLPWADMSAHFAGAATPGGVAIFVSPAHPDYPPEWMTRHYGVLCVGWPGVQAKAFPPGQPVRCRYRLWIHRGVPEAAALQKIYDEYARASSNAPPIAASDLPDH